MNDVQMLVVHSQPLVVAGINSFLVRMPNWRIVESVPDARSAIRFLRTHMVNVMLTEKQLGGLNGITLCGIVRNFFPTISTAIIGNLTTKEQVIAYAHGVGLFIPPTVGHRELRTLAQQLRRVPMRHPLMLHHPHQIAQWHALARHVAINDEHLQPPHLLSQREQDVVKLMCTGATNKEIARHLGISAHTVKQHLSSAMHKCNVHKRTELRRIAINMGWD
ncbi:MAG: response regulator transcription factor [Chloroflexi bacterium]|nr:response regulator transcription factor [Chloroflexota bacterium]